MLNYLAMERKILLMYITHGSGHHSATMAIERAIESHKNHPPVLNINGFGYSHPIMEKVTHAVYMNVIKKVPKVWDSIYDNPKFALKTSRIKDTIHRRSRSKIKRLIEKENCKVVICSQAFPCGLVADYKKHCPNGISLIAVVTDFIPHSYWVYDEIDYYIIGSSDAMKILLNKGVKREKIMQLGIPIDLKFTKTLGREDVSKELNISLDRPIILIMGGGRGLGPIKEIIKKLENLNFNAHLLVVAGINRKLLKFLNRARTKHKIHVFGYIDYIDKLMTLADILVTKPGGVTTAEALSKGLPMLIINPLPGQEQNNTDFLIRQGAVHKADDVEDAVGKLNFLLAHKDILERTREKVLSLSMPDSSIKIAELALGLC